MIYIELNCSEKECANKNSYECVGCYCNNGIPKDDRLWCGFRQKSSNKTIKGFLKNSKKTV